jgi:hypothetical protein
MMMQSTADVVVIENGIGDHQAQTLHGHHRAHAHGHAEGGEEGAPPIAP